jgi:rare lipoprotein A
MQGVLIILLIVAIATEVTAQEADNLRRADSLTKEWDAMWRRSDSLRVEAMFMRMRADSLRRATPRPVRDTMKSRADTTMVNPATAPPEETIDSLILERVRKGKVSRGTTLSDTLTAKRLMVEPEEGIASYYAEKFHGRSTSSGERFNMHDKTCAHRWLPFGTMLRVTNLKNDKRVVVRVNDRGPWKHGRLLDVSKAAAIDLDMIRDGTARVRIEVVADTTEAAD